MPGKKERSAEVSRYPLTTYSRRIGRLPRIWARSLMFRAVFFTGLLTLLGTGLVAYFLVQQVTSGLFQERFEQVEMEATQELISTRAALTAGQATDSSETSTLVHDTVNSLESQAAQLPRVTTIMPLEEAGSLYLPTQSTTTGSQMGAEVISEELKEAVLNGTEQYWQPVGIMQDGQEIPGVAFGTQVQLPPGHAYGIFFVYDFSSVQENVNFVFRVFLVAAGVILVMNMLIAAWVSRSVVQPVSQAAQVSERIASGQLDQRLAVVGEDEIARLGVSFNRMASTLQEQITQLANLSKMQQRFVSDVSHELRTPLTTISMAADMLHESRHDFDPISRRSAELLHHQVERFQALLADLLEMSRFDAGAAELALGNVDLLDLSREVLVAAQPLADQSGTELSIVVQGGSEASFIAEVDRRRIDRILRNLVNNAIEHSEGRPVDLVIAASPTAVGIAVRDHGIGMTPAEVAHVFDRFWRADPARARTTGGSGLGLSIATEDTRLHQGTLDAWGQKGQGACFRLVVPRRQDTPYGASPLALPPVYQSTDRENVDSETIITGEIAYDRVQEQALVQQKEGRS
ncbi:MtrAB system histidine kinase MtrB [Nesterenkonia flava]|uniref:Sensor histidine kinase MtrB n=2 Tax=Nesterenkonia flava TaxID=469799 RepID=A0ABU1FUW5_9MICC|nr:MtrAB system histidine kinase MtrB [Nesterenkonia flava]MDR5712460.1 MtrAB system histidine kinase MtrB [Nesterenkonia flava]